MASVETDAVTKEHALLPESSATSTEKEKMKKDMISRLSGTDAHFRHQQRGEPDLGHEEKANIALDILHKSPAKFLERFSQYLTQEDTAYFEDMKGDYMIDFYLKEISKRCADTNHNMVKNRRYQALQKLVDEGEYFSQNEMKWRDPLLFEQMVGQYETEAEQDAREIDRSDLKFSSILLKHMDANTNKQLYDKMKEMEDGQDEEEEESSDEDDMEKNDTEGEMDEEEVEDLEKDRELEDDESEISEADRSHLKTEFLRIMQERFLSGQDANFDYGAVDSNTDYDSLDILGHDAEEKYFDAEDPESRMSQESSDQEPACVTRACADSSSTCTTGLLKPHGDHQSGEARVAGGGELLLDLRTGLRGMGLKEKSEGEEEVEDYMSYEPSEELVQESQDGNVAER
ncbi:coiled-coil domain-containing protein 97 [Aplysia californica]|uniref:Coiled-coil domain-containing protein 97 n=1 Tax=Aplysia californica TaxID=6500 RepID=A0ABM0JKL4_APLCA|nr:coiled-coil domain-containing protein 97 [Aplysia californica]